MELSEAASLMDDIEYLKRKREENKEWAKDFRKRYGIPEQRTDDHFPPAELYAAHAGHAEYGSGAH